MNRLEQIEAIMANPLTMAVLPEPLGVDLRDLLAVARASAALTEPTSPIRGLGACCIYCGEDVLNDGHHSECPWLEFQAALGPLLKEVEP